MNAPEKTLGADPTILRRKEGPIETLVLNRAAQYNSIPGAMIEEIRIALEEIARDEGVRAVVIAGRGKAFCAGHDLKEMMANRTHEFTRELFDRCCRMMMTIQRMPQPVIARVHGMATAAGCQLVAMCDLAVAAESATFATSGITLGLFCTTPGVAVARNLLRKNALEMLLTGEFIDARKAQAWGLVNRVVPDAELDAELKRVVDAIISRPRDAIALGKKVFYEQIELPIGQAYDIASEAMACNMMLDDTAEGVGAFIAKRKPNWAS
ncbi:MAG: enoyl-CoA hydratase [Betaproteobacteria bacterium RIFCSPLOWO2_02_FULL_66_14]|nr:MAG: enoyl-CoA hydratase [Betaproteobacteria bacterium RIFCSPLOWO2_02_FULL_66_14]